ncbi:hypothetical protein GQ44DRAFT_464453 [Phaeosphaeriaceae sp. PMI808]|nr:hypothetical protein GQ44DRAFT_464453 [Phaeosphaeriaceae sp. PMI808]
MIREYLYARNAKQKWRRWSGSGLEWVGRKDARRLNGRNHRGGKIQDKTDNKGFRLPMCVGHSTTLARSDGSQSLLAYRRPVDLGILGRRESGYAWLIVDLVGTVQ